MRCRVCLALLMIGVGWGPPAWAWAWRIEVSPLAPTTADSVHVRVYGGFANDCRYGPLVPVCGFAAPDTVAISIAANYCGGAPGCICLTVPVYYVRSCHFGPFPAGTYTVHFAERHVNPADREATSSVTTSFTVSTVTPGRRWSWSKVKSFYR